MFDLKASTIKPLKLATAAASERDVLDTAALTSSLRGTIIPRQRLSQQGALTEYKFTRAHTRDLGFENNPPEIGKFDQTVLEIETARGRAFHSGVNLATMERWRELSEDAQNWGFRELEMRARGFNRHPILLGTTSRVVDHNVDAEGLNILIRAVYSDSNPEMRNEKLAALRRAIEDGPPLGEHSEEDNIFWSSPKTPEQLVASIIRCAVLGGGDKRRTRVSPELRLWIKAAYDQAGYEPHAVLGGYAAYGTQLALALGYVPTMLSLWKYPTSLYDSALLPKETKIIADRKDCITIADLRPDEMVASAGHYCFSLGNSGDVFLPEELANLRINGAVVNIDQPHRVEVIVSGSHAEPGFGDRTPDEMREIGKAHALLSLTGLQYYEDKVSAMRFFNQLSYAREAGTPATFEYSEPKDKARPHEMAMLNMASKMEACELIAMNTSEAFGLLERVLDDLEGGLNLLNVSPQLESRIRAALAVAELEETEWGDGREDPRWITDSALIIQEILDRPFVRVRGMWADITISSSDISVQSPLTVRRALFFSRDQALVKTANPSGSIRSLADQARVWASPTGQCVAAAAVVNEHMHAQFAEQELASDSFMQNAFARLSDNRAIFFALTKPMLVTDGGTTSAGDTMSIVLSTGILSELTNALRTRRKRLEKAKYPL